LTDILIVKAGQPQFGLARATHRHAYDLAPTAAELRRWLDLVRTVLSEVTTAGHKVGVAAE
jgi:hypothetical protein